MISKRDPNEWCIDVKTPWIRQTSSLNFYYIHHWLKAEIGKENKDWLFAHRVFYFKHEEDKVKFILRWL